jgi:hypothetical protein
MMMPIGAFLPFWICFIPLHGLRDKFGMHDELVTAMLDTKDSISLEEEPPQCPRSIPREYGGDPSKNWCCANGAKMFQHYRYVTKSGDESWLSNGCRKCSDAENRSEVFNVEVKTFTSKDESATSWTEIVTYADLDPKIPPENGPLYASDGTFNPAHPYVLFLYTKEDHNGAFAFTEKLCDRLNCWGSRGYKVVMRRIATKAAAKRVLDKFPDDSLHHAVLSGHGSPSRLRWGYGSDGTLDTKSSGTEQFLFKLREKVKINGTVLLDACQNAGDRIVNLQNLFEYVASKLPGRRVTASKISLTDSMWESAKPGEVPRDTADEVEADFDETCQAGDRVRFIDDGEDQTAVRQRGRPNCKELKLKDITKFDSCLSRCRSYCSDVWKRDWNRDNRKNARVTLVPDEAAAQEIVNNKLNPCWFGRKEVCKIQAK